MFGFSLRHRERNEIERGTYLAYVGSCDVVSRGNLARAKGG